MCLLFFKKIREYIYMPSYVGRNNAKISNQNSGGGSKLQGLPPLKNQSNLSLRAITKRAGGERRNLIFCINQLGGIGRNKSQFVTGADGAIDCTPGEIKDGVGISLHGAIHTSIWVHTRVYMVGVTNAQHYLNLMSYINELNNNDIPSSDKVKWSSLTNDEGKFNITIPESELNNIDGILCFTLIGTKSNATSIGHIGEGAIIYSDVKEKKILYISKNRMQYNSDNKRTHMMSDITTIQAHMTKLAVEEEAIEASLNELNERKRKDVKDMLEIHPSINYGLYYDQDEIVTNQELVSLSRASVLLSIISTSLNGLRL